jgi:hypothetical protein
MKLPAHKTKIVCTIGPASNSEAVLERLMLQGMNVVRSLTARLPAGASGGYPSQPRCVGKD